MGFIPDQMRYTYSMRRARNAVDQTRGYVGLKEEVWKDDGWALYNFTERDMYERDALIVAVIKEDDDPITVLAGLNVIYQGNGAVYIAGVLTHPTLRRRGLASKAVALTLDWLSQAGVKSAELAVRIKDSEINKAAYAMFLKFGFKPVEDRRVPIFGTYIDQHLNDSLDGGSTSFLARWMRADLTLRNSKRTRARTGRSI
jgi:RimJ/RimL family protein N-acetyltransferase